MTLSHNIRYSPTQILLRPGLGWNIEVADIEEILEIIIGGLDLCHPFKLHSDEHTEFLDSHQL